MVGEERTTGAEQSAHSGADTFVLVDRAQAGDAGALGLLVTRYYPRIRRIVGIRAGAQVLARDELDDLVQDVLMRVLRGLERFERRGDAQFIQWVSRLASNEIRDKGRRASRRDEESPSESVLRERLASESQSALGRIANREEQDLVDSCLSELDESHREVLLLRDYAGASWEEVQEELQRPSINACQVLYQRARRALGDRLLLRGVGREAD